MPEKEKKKREGEKRHIMQLPRGKRRKRRRRRRRNRLLARDLSKKNGETEKQISFS